MSSRTAIGFLFVLASACGTSRSPAETGALGAGGGAFGGTGGIAAGGAGGAGGVGGRAAMPDAASASDAAAPSPDTGAAIADAAPADAPVPPADAAPAAARHYLYVGGLTELAVFDFDVTTGRLAKKQSTAMPVRTVYVAVSPDKRRLYAANGEAPGRVIAFAIDAATGTLARLNDASTSDVGDALGVSHVAVHPGGKWLLTSHVASGRVAVLPLASDGQVGAPVDSRIFAVGAHHMISDRGGTHVLVPVRDGNFIAQFLFDAATGKLTPNTPARVPTPAGSGPRHLALDPAERFAYVNYESNGTMAVYGYDAASGRLTFVHALPTVPEGFKETGTAHVLVHPSGKFVYGSNRFHNSIAIYARDAESGRLRTVGIEGAGGDIRFPRDFTFDPSGRLMIVGNERGNSVLVLRVNEADGTLTKIGAPVAAPAGPQVTVVVALP